MKLCPQCEFIYEDDQKFCDMDGQELVHDPQARIFAESVPVASPQLQAVQDPTPVTKIRIPIPDPLPSPASNAASQPPPARSAWRPGGLAVAALAGLVLVALLFVVYYARTHQSQTPKANRSASQTAGQLSAPSDAQPATRSADAQAAAPGSSDSATLAAQTAAEQALDETPSDRASESAGLSSTASQPATLATANDRSESRPRQGSTTVAARASAEPTRAPVIIRLNNGASIKVDEAWEKREGVWYRQAGMVTFIKRSRVKSIQRPAASARSQTEPRAEKSLAQNQPRTSQPEAAHPKQNSKMTSFLKKTGRILKKPFKF